MARSAPFCGDRASHQALRGGLTASQPPAVAPTGPLAALSCAHRPVPGPPSGTPGTPPPPPRLSSRHPDARGAPPPRVWPPPDANGSHLRISEFQKMKRPGL